jgi:hypothetical protein
LMSRWWLKANIRSKTFVSKWMEKINWFFSVFFLAHGSTIGYRKQIIWNNLVKALKVIPGNFANFSRIFHQLRGSTSKNMMTCNSLAFLVFSAAKVQALLRFFRRFLYWPASRCA